MIRRFFRTVADVIVTIGVHLGIVRWPKDEPKESGRPGNDQ
ncbi:hypothetical protein [Amycolatopsis palatopharyngis]|nr:hypothetical protein [Amycolatopsis palatopharyngis]